MKLTQQFLSINEYTRNGKLRNDTLAIVKHWTGPNGHNARQVWDYFENDCPKLKHYSSANYIIDFTGEIIQLVPDNEMTYHCGSSIIDPTSEVIYTDWARNIFGKYANIEKYKDPKKIKLSPNQASIGVEMCAIDGKGNFRDATIAASIELDSYLCLKYKLTTNKIGTHNMVVGWKDCPRLWVNKNYLFDAYIEDVKRSIILNEDK
jgi:N-acetylmuramoyl-L-alanine amidase